MAQRWGRQVVEKIVNSVLDCEYEPSTMRVASWKAPRDLSPYDDLTLTLDMISQAEERPSGGLFISHSYWFRIEHGVLTALIEVPSALVESALARGLCVITSVIVANDATMKAVRETARPLAIKLTEIAQLLEQVDAGRADASNTDGGVASSATKPPKRV